MEEVDGEELVKKFAEEMEGMLGRKMKSVKRLAEAAEDADLYHEFNATLEVSHSVITPLCSSLRIHFLRAVVQK